MIKTNDLRTYVLENEQLKVQLSNMGGAILNFIVKDVNNNDIDIVLGHKEHEDYIDNPGNHGVVIGRNANRIEDGEITIDGIKYDLEKNDGTSNLHSGSNGLQKRLFDVEEVSKSHLRFTTTMKHLSDDFPGNLEVTINYELEDSSLLISYEAQSDQRTIVNLCNHSYWNLNGQDNSNIYNHSLHVNSNYYMPNNDKSLPTREILNNSNTPYDFTQLNNLEQSLTSDFAQVALLNGFDNNFLLNNNEDNLVATLSNDDNNLKLNIYTNLRAMHIYTGNHFPDAVIGKSGKAYPLHGGIAFETQLSPNSVNMPWLSSPILDANEKYHTFTKFEVVK